ncbi:MAG: VanZ family protein [Bacillota bacterium]
MKICFRRSATTILIGYSLLLSYWMLWGFGRRVHSEYMYNLKPLSTIKHFMQISSFNSNTWMINLAGNIGVFVPFGVLIPLIFGKKYTKLVIIFLSGLSILEILQLITRRGSFDIDDFILNTLGATIGYGIYRIVRWWFYLKRGGIT